MSKVVSAAQAISQSKDVDVLSLSWPSGLCFIAWDRVKAHIPFGIPFDMAHDCAPCGQRAPNKVGLDTFVDPMDESFAMRMRKAPVGRGL